ncbi:IS3 family transposase [Corynebacterium jeikeium]|uniref:Transposase for IS3513 n=1 Tax=Corynebacterium jeikeium (strain K411) TaxID=306537 RepID=Q4JUD1_CORJK|nr:Integrase core domain protein [Corynebacterium jeikeium]CAI37576.1 transposase for IS3513 [Corynebacterium jeikeium K411]SUY80681.1 transposase IS3513 [Corynebacterium jeikeium]SUY85079.1 transposase IS3513 [Corynebacterium jeikeium]
MTMMARLLRVSRAGYYGWKKRRNQNYPLSTPRGFRDQIADDVREIFAKHNGFAGVRTIATELGTRGITATLYAVRKTMRTLGLVTKYRRAFKRTTIADANARDRSDLVRRNFTPPVPTTYLCGDITYLRTGQGWMYLATVIDLSTRMVTGWQVADRMTSQLVIDALDMAHRSGYVAGNAIFHSDRGAQYTSAALSQWAENHDVRLSVGEVGVCWDNAVAESFFSTLKLHLLYERKQFVSKLEARTSVGEWIEAYYNRRRIHTSTEEIPKKAMDDFLTTPVTTAAQAA